MQEKPNSTQNVNTFQVSYSDNQAPQRLDVFLASSLDASRSRTKKLITSGLVQVNSEINYKPSHTLNNEDRVTVTEVKHTSKKLPEVPIIFENSNLIVINKPYGTLVHPADTSTDETIADKFDYISDKYKHPSIVHRLDRTTSGVMALAKNDEYREFIQAKFKTREVKKSYIAVVNGLLKDSEFIIDAEITRDLKNRKIFKVDKSGKQSVTKVKVLAKSAKQSLLCLSPLTGRTHQLRVHLKFVNRPIIGDKLYGGNSAERLMLHAYSLSIPVDITEKKQTFFAKIEQSMQQYIYEQFKINEAEIKKLVGQS